MDVKEIIRYKPDNMKRPANQDPADYDELNEDDSYEATALKRKIARKKAQELAARAQEEERMAMLEEEARLAKMGNVESDRDKIQEILEKGDDVDALQLDEAGIKRILLAFEKKALRNQETRIKFPDQPEKFMESEMELHDAIQDMHNVATVPELYPIIVDLNCVPSLLGLLSHENTDIYVAVVDLLQELLDIDTMTESEEGAESLIQALIDNQIFSLLVSNMDRLNESVREEADGVHNTLAILENIIEFRPSACQEASQAGFMAWLIKKLKVKVPFDANKLYASEILSILLQNEPENRKLFGEMDALDSLLQQLAYYKRHDPNQVEEGELMENLFNCLCSLLLEKENRDRFLQGEGIQLMNLMLREKKNSRSGALRVLDHALTGVDGKDNCIKFVDVLGLRTIFPLFMKTPKKSKRSGMSVEEYEEHIISIIASLFKNCTVGNQASKQRERLLAKFTENDHEKVDRLMELHDKYYRRVEIVDKRIEEDMAQSDLEDEEIYLRRLQGGLFTLQFVDYIVLEICNNAASSVKQRVLQILNLRGGALKAVRDVVREFAGNLGDDTEDHEKKAEQEYLLSLVDKF